MTDILDFLRRMNESAGGTMPAWGIVLRVTVLLSATLLVALVLRRSSAALRHLVWTLSLVGTLLVPLCSWVLPAWQWAVLPQREPSPPSVAPVVKDAPQSPVVAPRTEDTPLRYAHSPPPLAGHSPLPAAPSADQPVEVPTTPPATIADHPTPPPVPKPKWSWPMLLAAAWAAGSFLGLVWLGVGVAAAWYVARRAVPAADPCWGEILRQLLDPCGIRRPVEVRECPQVSVPMTWSLFRPVILVPAGSAAWSEEIKRSVLLHELGHIRRGDGLMLLLGRLACVAYWFHPLAWLAARQLRKTSEQAADDLVLASHVAPPDYAEHLVGIAARMRGLHLFGHVALPMASPSDLEGRVLAILDPRRNHRSLKRKTCYALMVLAVLLVIPSRSCGWDTRRRHRPRTQIASLGNNPPREKSRTPPENQPPARQARTLRQIHARRVSMNLFGRSARTKPCTGIWIAPSTRFGSMRFLPLGQQHRAPFHSVPSSPERRKKRIGPLPWATGSISRAKTSPRWPRAKSSEGSGLGSLTARKRRRSKTATASPSIKAGKSRHSSSRCTAGGFFISRSTSRSRSTCKARRP